MAPPYQKRNIVCNHRICSSDKSLVERKVTPKKGVTLEGQKGVVELVCQPGFELFQAGKIHHKATVVEFMGPKPETKTAAISMHEAAVALVAPLAMAAGITAEGFTAAVGRSGHG